MNQKTIPYLFALAAALVLAVLIAALQPQGIDLQGYFGFAVMLWLALSLLLILWRWAGSETRLAWILLAAFFLRLIVGIGLSLALPVFGHDTPTSQAGYIFLDAFRRDAQAWELAQSGLPLWSAFGNEFYGDQYGGMLAVSAAIYRLLSPDEHRAWLVLILTAFSAAAGAVFLYRGLRARFSTQVASLAVWIYALYPESILLGAAQMRDPILIGLTSAAFYSMLTWRDHPRRAVWLTGLLLLVMAGFSWLVALPVAAVLLLWWWLEYSPGIARRRLRWLGWALAGIAGLTGLLLIGAWLRDSAAWDARLTAQGSGWIQSLFADMPGMLRMPFLLIYGLAQPVLPAALFDPSLPLWNGISTFRALGWYLLLPLIFYTPIALRKHAAGDEKRLLFFTFVMIVAWVLISSYRAGGDLWDNPRYRTLFIPWLALLTAWAWTTGRRMRDPWLLRWYLAEGIFLLVFGLWYANRSFRLGLEIPFWGMVGAIAGSITLLLLGGVLVDFFRSGRFRHSPVNRMTDPLLTVRSLRLLFLLGGLIGLLSLLLPAAYLGVSETWFEVLRIHHRAIILLVVLVFAVAFALSFTRLWTGMVNLCQQNLTWLHKKRLVTALTIACLSLVFPLYQLYAQPLIKIRPYVPPLLLFGLLVLAGAWLWWSFRPAKSIITGLAAVSVLYSAVYLLALQLPRISNYPFSFEWSEGSRIYEASQVYATLVYGKELPLPILDVGRGILQGLPFIFPGLSIGFHRFWLVLLEIGTAFLAVYLLARRCQIADRLIAVLFVVWGVLFLYQGPIFHHLLVVVMLVIWRFDAARPWKSLVWVLLASAWAGLTRINWFPVAGMLAALLYLIETPIKGRSLRSYLTVPVVYAFSGGLTAFAVYFVYIAISGNPPGHYGTSLSSTLLWERLWPNASFSLGILPGIVLVSFPLAGLILGRLLRNRGGWHGVRVAGIFTILLVFLIGGVIVSLKVGGGNNLHNLDAYLYLLLAAGSLVIFEGFTPDKREKAGVPNLSRLWLAFLVLVPVGFALTSPVMIKPPEEQVVRVSLEKLQRSINRVADDERPILFIGNRQLIAFRFVHGVEIVPEYERVILSEMAMAGSQEYLNAFYQDLANHRYALIVMEPMNLQYQDDTYRFAFENNLFVDTIFKPVNDYYKEDVILRPVGISTYRPRR